MLKSISSTQFGFGMGLFFSLAFMALGDSLMASLGFGILGGYSIACLVKWWQIDEKNNAPEPSKMEVFTDNLSEMLTHSQSFQSKSKTPRTPTQATTLLGWIFKRNKT